MFKKILLAYNGSREGKSALLACAEIAAFAHSETHLLAVAGMPSSMFLTEGFLPEELLEEEKKRAQEILNEGIAQLKKKGFTVAGHLAVGEPVEEISRLAAELKRSEEHTSELQSHSDLVCRLLLEKKKNIKKTTTPSIKNRTT